MIWDTHAHLDDPRFQEKYFAEVCERAKLAGITRILNPGFNLPSSKRAVQLAQDYEFIYAAIGVHPHNAVEATPETWASLFQLAKKPKVLAWGEIGLDYYRDLSPRVKQKEVFIQQIELANQAGLPIVIHNRDSNEDCLKIIKEHPPEYGGAFHCYSASWEMAKILLRQGFYLSFAGPLTYKNARNIVEVAKNIPLDRFFVETDSPYLTPEPHRGQRNEPAFVREVIARMAELRNMSFEQIASMATNNAKRFFKTD
ncbi:MAG TPA: TatD family hydrolase [Desulfitobacteriaceae bacterium]|jgi:TatD DNase family protein|nr:TatD family hydrolase [Desulfitobacteriaceae bacterium]